MIGFLCLLLTVGIYFLAKRMYRSLPKVYLSPLLITPLLVVGVLLATGTDYAAYNSGGRWLSLLLQPATVAFAVPLYTFFHVLKKHISEIVVSVMTGSVVAVLSSAMLAKWLRLDSGLIHSLIPRSITTPIAMNVSASIGGIPAVTAVFVIMTGLLGAIMGPSIVKMLRIDSEIAKGTLLGTGAHGTGTSKAFELSSLTGTISSISMVLAALFTLAVAPTLSKLIFP
ncbi:Inner membrane protein YohK [Paenibacillus sp. JJ-100]|uniref:CidB/LrgB family autolysis modulator n=1 Tax=Paenibacillus sp. JJ-100 TaxID=2974896 RepID=UPI0022FF76AD|nr:CidB/LrgB family autolysis modulator [Paenibacillus sp. JJ-100]CAI6080699.1 Inner membrane protein YohK [Paenibacillus sp. JJ-100]